jgi:hypothetical protein
MRTNVLILITPKDNLPLAGYSARNKGAVAVLNDLYSRLCIIEHDEKSYNICIIRTFRHR